MICAACLFVALSLSGADLQQITVPLEISAPDDVAQRWHSYVRLQDGVSGSINVLVDGKVPQGEGRVDLLRSDGTRWKWLSTSRYTPDLRVSPGDHVRGMLLRFQGSNQFFWSEIPAYSSKAVTLRPFKTLTIRAPEGTLTVALYQSSEDTPRLGRGVRSTFRMVPAEPGLACIVSTENESHCEEVGADTVAIDLDAPAARSARILHVDLQRDDEYAVLARGHVEVAPRKIPASLKRAYPWVAIIIKPSKPDTWNEVAVRRQGKDFAYELIEGASLPSPPLSLHLDGRRDRGVLVRPFVGRSKTLLADASAQLAVFGVTDGVVSPTPLLTASPDINGDFDLPVGSGDYALKLLTTVTIADSVRVSATPGVQLDVTFPTGPVVSGRIVRTAGGATSERPYVEVAIATTLDEALRTDLTDQIRSTATDEAGNFRVAVRGPGKYRLLARWGTARAEREFEVGKGKTDISLGEIVLHEGSTLHGFIRDCEDGQIALIPAPDRLTNKLSSGIGEVRYAPVDSEGRFIVSGLAPASWSVSAKCGGDWIGVSPQIVPIPADGVTTLEFTLLRPVPPET